MEVSQQSATPAAPTQERPLVTFALFAYNQERFIREAVEGALAKTYSHLQIISAYNTWPPRSRSRFGDCRVGSRSVATSVNAMD